MRVVLLHNPSAGSEDHTDREIQGLIHEAGHEVVKTVARIEELGSILDANACDVVAVAGGDGTVSRAACTLAHRPLSIAVLPLGTANNTALTMGQFGELRDIVSRWSTSRQRSIDLAWATLGAGRIKFAEAIGWGIFPDIMARTQDLAQPQEPEQTLERDRFVFHSVIAKAKPRYYEIEADGEDCSGEYLLVEVLNIPFIGPRLELCSASDPGDGVLELVLARESDRAALLDLASTGTFEPTKQVHARSVKRVVIRASEAHHRDGSLFRYKPGAREIAVTPEPSAVRYVVPE